MLRLAPTLLAAVALGGLIASTSTIAKSNDVETVFARQSTSKRFNNSGKTKYVDNFLSFKNWADEDVPYIISADERSIFSKLSINEERTKFVEQFWLRRDPTPDTERNEFKEEHYRRIAYANEHFGTSVPGWKTDRGRVYIIFGAPDSLIPRDDCEGSNGKAAIGRDGLTDCHPSEVWRYNYVEFTGPNVKFEFVDRSGSGDYELTKDPTDKTPMYFDPCCDDGSVLTAVPPPPKSREWFLSSYAQPLPRFPDLNALVAAQIKRDQLGFRYRSDSVRATTYTNIVQISLKIPNRELDLNDAQAVHTARINIYGRISTSGGRVVEVFGDSIPPAIHEASRNIREDESLFYRHSTPLSPGLYRLDFALKDAVTGKVGIKNGLLRVPRFEVAQLDAITPIIAEQVEVAPKPNEWLTELHFRDFEVLPRVNSEFISTEKLEAFMQIYNLRVSRESNSPTVTVAYRISPTGNGSATTIESFERSRVTREQMTIHRSFPSSSLDAGSYKLTIDVTDEIAHQTISRSAEFTVVAGLH